VGLEAACAYSLPNALRVLRRKRPGQSEFGDVELAFRAERQLHKGTEGDQIGDDTLMNLAHGVAIEDVGRGVGGCLGLRPTRSFSQAAAKTGTSTCCQSGDLTGTGLMV